MEFSLAITILLSATVFLLALILIIIFRINKRIAFLLHQYINISRSTESLAQAAESPKIPSANQLHSEIEVPSGTFFEKFLNEDPTRRSLPKKEKFKAYRSWRREKGLNWHTKE